MRLALTDPTERVGIFLRFEIYQFLKHCVLGFKIPDDGQSPERQ
jgi:hypothetical protein